jgi:uncharacterized membrane protein YphA (DoxX/SURF4 family)
MSVFAALALLLARLFLVLMFLTAGLTKLLDRAESRRALVEFGVWPSLVIPLGVILPVAELVTAVALIPEF